MILWIIIWCFIGCQEKIPPEKNPPCGVRGKVRVRLGIGLGVGPGFYFPGGFFPRTVSLLSICETFKAKSYSRSMFKDNSSQKVLFNLYFLHIYLSFALTIFVVLSILSHKNRMMYDFLCQLGHLTPLKRIIQAWKKQQFWRTNKKLTVDNNGKVFL